MPITGNARRHTRSGRPADRSGARRHHHMVRIFRPAIEAADGLEMCGWKVSAAMRVALRESGTVFATLRGIGYRRLTIDRLGSDVGQSARTRIRRTTRRATATIGLGLAKANDVPNEARIRALREQSALGLIEFLARDRHLPTVDPERMRPLRPQHVLRQTLESLGINP